MPAPFTTRPMQHIHHPIGCCGASCRGFGQKRRGVAAICADLPPLGCFCRWWQPLHLLELLGATKTPVYTTILKECSQNDATIKMVGRMAENSKILWGVGDISACRGQYAGGGFSWHTFANLGILPPHNTLQSTQYYLTVGVAYYRRECNNKNRFGAHPMCKNRVMMDTKSDPQLLALFLFVGYPPDLGH